MYESVVDEFQLKIIAKRKDYQTFDEVMEYLVDLLFNRDPVLRQHAHKRLTRAVLFYMYWNCDIGEVGDAAADQAPHPDRTVINVSLLLLARLKARRVDEYDVLHVREKCRRRGRAVPAGTEFSVSHGPDRISPQDRRRGIHGAK